MSRSNDEIPMPLGDLLTSTGEGAPSLDEKVQLVQSLRRSSERHERAVDRYLVGEIGRLRGGLLEAQASQRKLKGLLEKLGATPWHPAVFLRTVNGRRGPRAVVMHGNSRRVVGLADEVDVDSLRKGDEVFLGSELNVVINKPAQDGVQCGEIAACERLASDGRLVLRPRGDEEVVVDVGGPLLDADVQPGDLVRWRRECWMAFEKLPRPERTQYLLKDVPNIGRDQVGGQHANLDMLLAALTVILVAPMKARSYRLSGRQSVLMVGPPGCGKTLMAQVAANEVSRLSGKKCRFAVVKPGEFEDPFVGVTQQKTRDCFETLRRVSHDTLAVLFLDEIDAVGRTRGGMVSHHADKALAALLAELDGFTDRSNVAVIAATNRKDLIDSALLERLSDLEVAVQRPDMRAACEIFEIHLPETDPFASNGQASDATRREVIETAVARFYSPGADNELCVLRFRDGKTRTVSARELVSGRCIEQVCRTARRAAFLRDVRGQEPGVCVADIETAVSDALRRLASTLTVRSVHAYLTDLPQDVDVVSVEPIVRKVTRPHRYLNTPLS